MKTNIHIKHYCIGFILSLIFTIIPFYIIQHNCFEQQTSYIIVIFCAITQIYIHLIYFLHLNQISNQMWNIISLIFTTFIVLILITGSIWIMTHLHHNLMS